eukprot:TRINITY_DN22887_c0_g2_i1.p6 TRINITY_DN22887_c0_g2~~TRINITY_DN22887_c0_g2_i1.p6  ORF type:complete len:106 (-),score=17.14 TRINITY_DN22887_c0_g2_i1:1020-1337(-)
MAALAVEMMATVQPTTGAEMVEGRVADVAKDGAVIGDLRDKDLRDRVEVDGYYTSVEQPWLLQSLRLAGIMSWFVTLVSLHRLVELRATPFPLSVMHALQLHMQR